MLQPVETMVRTLDFSVWFDEFSTIWLQGEHVVIIGQTGSGKTFLARDLLKARDFVAAFAIKRDDPTLDTFKGHGYSIIKSWPPEYYKNRVVIWYRPTDLSPISIAKQRNGVYEALDDIFHNGGWTVFLDDVGYIASVLRLHEAIGILLNQGRASGISMVTAMTQPTSMVQKVPSESLRQVLHKIIFPYSNEKDIKVIAEISGIDWHVLKSEMTTMTRRDFLVVSHGELTRVRNIRRAA